MCLVQAKLLTITYRRSWKPTVLPEDAHNSRHKSAKTNWRQEAAAAGVSRELGRQRRQGLIGEGGWDREEREGIGTTKGGTVDHRQVWGGREGYGGTQGP